MIARDETAAVIALLRRGDRPWHHYAQLIETAGSAIDVLEGRYHDPDEPEHLTLFPAGPADEGVDLAAIAGEIEAWEAEGMTLVTVMDERYPVNLRSIYNRPPLLFVHGELSPEDDRSVAVVGTRHPSPEGLRAARAIADGLAAAGYAIVSGLAQGIDAEAHGTALDRGARTVAVVGTGLRLAYPRQHADLQRRIAERGAVVSQFWPDQPPTQKTFPLRNIVMSGFALATVVIEASGTSGARMQARFALEHGRRVFLYRPLLEHGWARDCAARPGVTVIDSAEEIVGRLDRLAPLDVVLTP